MPLETLLELVQTLSHRIDRHGPALRQSEALTRYALIDPLLRELGWNTSNPDMVIPEYRSGNGRADYALMNNGSPAMMVEAKSLGTPLRDTVPLTRHQLLPDGRHKLLHGHRRTPLGNIRNPQARADR